ncbi:MAG: hypothetical protein ISR72_00490 [Methylobacter sp.]|nr:hypothetical protein [Methylobacter sp.]
MSLVFFETEINFDESGITIYGAQFDNIGKLLGLGRNHREPDNSPASSKANVLFACR